MYFISTLLTGPPLQVMLPSATCYKSFTDALPAVLAICHGQTQLRSGRHAAVGIDNFAIFYQSTL